MTTPGGSATLPLQGVRVLDLTQGLGGAFCTLILADFGAEVIKIERPRGGDSLRSLGAVRSDASGRSASSEFVYLGRNKRSMTLDIRGDAGKTLVRRLALASDVLVEGFKADYMDGLGLGYRDLSQINDGLVYSCISGFGHSDIVQSPIWRQPGFNPQIQALSGVVDLTGQADGPPADIGVPLADFVPALFAVIGILLALEARRSSGRGQLVDVSMYDALMTFSARAFMRYSFAGELVSRGRGLYSAVITSIVRCGDGYVSLSVLGDKAWQGFCAAIGHPELLHDPRLQSERERVQHNEELIRPLLAAWAGDKTRAEVGKALAGSGVGVGPVQNAADLQQSEHLRARRMLVEIGDMLGGTVVVPGSPIKLSAMSESAWREAPTHGQHTESVLVDVLGMAQGDVARLRAEGVI